MSPRQLECLAAYAKGGTQSEAAHALGISVQTFKNHISAAYDELGATCMAEAFHALGWLRLPSESELVALSAADVIATARRDLIRTQAAISDAIAHLEAA